jgi:hypothetical protein
LAKVANRGDGTPDEPVTRPWLRWLANGFVLAYAADAGLSGLDEALRAATDSTALLGARNALAGLVMWASLAVPLAVALTPRLPAALFLVLALSALWLNFGAAPLPLWVGANALAPVAVGSQLALAALSFVWIRRRNGGAGWLLRDETLAGPSFAPLRSLAWCAGLLFVGLPLVALYLVLWGAASIQHATAGFIAFDASGVLLSDRRYTREDREVRLVGMMHLGDGEAYRALVRSFGGEETAVLQEGVTDAQGLMAKPLSYGRAAAILGLDEQEALETYEEDVDEPDEEPSPTFLHADVDVSSFAPETRAWLERIAQLYAADDFWQELRALGAWTSERAAEWPTVQRDIFARRNEHVLGRLDETLAHYRRVVVPWGALHQPALEQAVLERGFERAEETRHRLFRWRDIAATLAQQR